MGSIQGQIRQYLAVISANIATMNAGATVAWFSPTIQKLNEPDSIIRPTPEQASWIGALVPLGAALGPFPGAYLGNKIGRKWALLSLTIPFVLSWILTIVATDLATLYVSKFLGGVGIGALFAVLPMYAGEIAEDNIRGGLGSLLNLIQVGGYMYEYAIGPFVTYIWLGIISLILPIVFAATFVFMPESPYYFLMKRKTEEASKSLQWLRHSTEEEVEKELLEIKNAVDEESKNSNSIKDLFSTRGNIRAMYLSVGILLFQQWNGVDTVLYYSTTIFVLSGSSLSEDISTIIVGAVMLIFSFVAPLFVDKIGRKKMLYISSFGMAVPEVALGVYFYLKDVKGTDLSSVGWLPVTSLITFIAFYSIGWGPIAWAVVGELFPSNVKGIATAVLASMCWLHGFFLIKYFPGLAVDIGIHVAYWIFAGACLLSTAFVYFLLPETKCKSLQEIQDILNRK